eukprot:gene16789-23064_t
MDYENKSDAALQPSRDAVDQDPPPANEGLLLLVGCVALKHGLLCELLACVAAPQEWTTGTASARPGWSCWSKLTPVLIHVVAVELEVMKSSEVRTTTTPGLEPEKRPEDTTTTTPGSVSEKRPEDTTTTTTPGSVSEKRPEDTTTTTTTTPGSVSEKQSEFCRGLEPEKQSPMLKAFECLLLSLVMATADCRVEGPGEGPELGQAIPSVSGTTAGTTAGNAAGSAVRAGEGTTASTAEVSTAGNTSSPLSSAAVKSFPALDPASSKSVPSSSSDASATTPAGATSPPADATPPAGACHAVHVLEAALDVFKRLGVRDDRAIPLCGGVDPMLHLCSAALGGGGGAECGGGVGGVGSVDGVGGVGGAECEGGVGVGVSGAGGAGAECEAVAGPLLGGEEVPQELEGRIPVAPVVESLAKRFPKRAPYLGYRGDVLAVADLGGVELVLAQ